MLLINFPVLRIAAYQAQVSCIAHCRISIQSVNPSESKCESFRQYLQNIQRCLRPIFISVPMILRPGVRCAVFS